MTSVPDIIEFIRDPQLLGLSLSGAQEALLRAIYGLPLSDHHLEVYRACTGRQAPPAGPFGEVTVIAGARAGKDSRIAAPIVVYEALFGGHEAHLAKGERAVIPLVAQDARGARVAFGYAKAYLSGSPLLASMAAEVLASEIHLVNRVSLITFPCTQRSLRGWSIPAAVLDEVGFFRLEGQADSDAEIQASVRRGMLSFPSPRMAKVSTPYMRGGVLYEDFRRAWGQDNPDVLVWRAPTALMNPTITPERLERERRLDPQRFAREYEAEFTEDLDVFVPPEWVEAAVVRGRAELPPHAGIRYVAAVDPSGGGADAFTLAIAHTEGRGPQQRVVQDVMKAWRRRGSESLDLVAVVHDIADTVRRYGLRSVVGDRYAGAWPRQAFSQEGITYLDAKLDRSGAYLELEPLLAQGRVDLLDHPLLARELKTLERRARPGGRVLVDHPRGHHDDLANALALAAARAMKGATSRLPQWPVPGDVVVTTVRHPVTMLPTPRAATRRDF